MFDEEEKLIVFFNRHMMGTQPLYQIKATEPESIQHWGEVKELFLNDPALKEMGSLNHTYTNPIKLASEGGRVYNFWRGVDGKPSYSFSDDNGENWSKGKIFFMPERIYNFRRPYTKVYSDGVDKIHFVFTDGHPRNEKDNSIYYVYYQKGSFFKADGTKIKDIDGEPLLPKELDVVYRGKEGKAKAWNWDIAQDKNGNPVIAYVKFPDDENHIYCYAAYAKGKWNNYDLINSGKWFPDTASGKVEPEPNYSGGMSIDHENTNALYLSVNRDSVFEIEKWITTNGGKSWKVDQLTQGSSKHNIRPFAIRNAKEGNPLQVVWMQNTKYPYFAYVNKGKFRDRFHSSIKMGLQSPTIENPLKKNTIFNIMRQVADWQMANPHYGSNELNWHYGAFYTGLRALSEVTEENRYINQLINIGKRADWQPLNAVFHADRLTVIDNWAWLYGIYKQPEMIDKSK